MIRPTCNLSRLSVLALCATALMLIGTAGAPANGATLALYEFTGASPASTDGNAATDAGAMQAINGGNDGTSSTDLGFSSTTNSTFIRGDSLDGNPVTELAAALDDDDYFSFTVTPTSGADVLNLASLIVSATVLGDPGGANTTAAAVFIQSSVAGFGSANPLLDSFSLDATDFTVDLTDAAFQGLSSIEFRFYAAMSDDGGGGGSIVGETIRMDDIELTGAVIPEPASLALIGLGIVTVLGRVRRG